MLPLNLSCFVIHVNGFRVASPQTRTSPFDSCLLIRRLAMESFQDLSVDLIFLKGILTLWQSIVE